MKKNLVVMIFLNLALVIAFVLNYLKQQSFIPLYVGILPLVLCNFIFSREFIRPGKNDRKQPPTDNSAKRRNVLSLLIMPIGFCIALPALIKFDSSLGWSPIVCFCFSVLLCVVIIAFYGRVKMALRKSDS